MTHVVLASTSPSRLEILRTTGITPQVVGSHVDEDAIEAAHGNTPIRDLAQVLARAKGEAVVARLLDGSVPVVPTVDGRDEPTTLVLFASDSILELDGRAIGKPHTPEATREVWTAMGGRAADLHTGHFVARLDRESPTTPWSLTSTAEAPATSRIHTVRPSPAELEAYIATAEPFEVAGALTIDGYGGAFVSRIEGDHHNVIGLSLPVLRDLVTSLGLFWPSLWDVHSRQ